MSVVVQIDTKPEGTTLVEGEDDIHTRGEAQWVSMTIKNWLASSSIKIQEAALAW